MIYLDANATTPQADHVAAAMARTAREHFGNPSSAHAAGRAAATVVERAQSTIQNSLTADGYSVIFTSGASESNNLALRGIWEASRHLNPSRDTVLIAATEHPSVTATAEVLADRGATVARIPVTTSGVVVPEALAPLLSDRVLLVAVMLANSETGVMSPVRDLADLTHGVGGLLLCDATQAVGKVRVEANELDADLLSLSGHKFYGPKGIGALLIKAGSRLTPQITGGGQQRGTRAGTLNTPAIAGLAAAFEQLRELLEESPLVGERRDWFAQALHEAIPGIVINGLEAPRLPNTLNVRFPGCDAEALMANMPDLACSAGTACHAGEPEPSEVLQAMGLSRTAASECLRFSLCVDTSLGDLEIAVRQVVDAVEYVRDITGWRGEA